MFCSGASTPSAAVACGRMIAGEAEARLVAADVLTAWW